MPTVIIDLKMSRRLAAAGALALALAACTQDDPGPTVPVVDPDKPGIGRLFDADGNPASGVTVRIYRVDEAPGVQAAPKRAAAFITRTDAEGRYDASSLPNGEYNVMASAEGEAAYQDSLPLGENAGTIPPDTLDQPGTLRGRVAVQPHHDPQTVTVQLMGTNRFVNLDPDGRFEFKDLAGGTYTARLVSTEAGYTHSYFALQVQAGVETVLQDTLKPIYTGIPVVTGLKVEYDTARGVATLRWDRSRYANLQDYLVYLDRDGDTLFAQQALGNVKDTVFVDTLFGRRDAPGSAPFLFEDTNAYDLDFRVRVRTKTGSTGPVFHTAHVRAVSPRWVATEARLHVPGDVHTVTVRDTVPVHFTFKNRTRKIASIRWYREEGAPPFRETEPGVREGKDSILHVMGAEPGKSRIIVVAVDEGGEADTAETVLTALDDHPSAGQLNVPASIMDNDTLRLKGTAIDRGRIVRWEWALGSEPFRTVSRPDTAFLFERSRFPGASLRVVFRATDEDGNAATATEDISVLPWTRKKSMWRPRWQMATVVADGRVYAFGGMEREGAVSATTRTVEVYDPASDTWTIKAPMPTGRANAMAFAVAGKLYVAGGRSMDQDGLERVEIYDPVSDSWQKGLDMPARADGAVVIKQGRNVFLLEGGFKSLSGNSYSYSVYFDTLSLGWSDYQTQIDNTAFYNYYRRTHLMGQRLGARVFTFGDRTERVVLGYNLENNQVARRASYPFNVYNQGWVDAGGKVLAAGGYRVTSNGVDFTGRPQSRTSSIGLTAYNLAENTSKDLAYLPAHVENPSLAVVDGKIILFGGWDPLRGQAEGRTCIFEKLSTDPETSP